MGVQSHDTLQHPGAYPEKYPFTRALVEQVVSGDESRDLDPLAGHEGIMG
ncbi:MAG: hypothetical protein WC382_11445 [Methanoregulaceae archaeon]|jgi:hypothetical protein